MARPTYAEVAELIKYDPETGVMIWRVRAAHLFNARRGSNERAAKIWNTRYAGTHAFAVVNRRRRSGALFNRCYLAHHIAWLLGTGRWPEHEIDHVNGDQADNRLVNLRDVPHVVNQQNMKKPTTNTSGFTGVYKVSWGNKWCARVNHHSTHYHLGYFYSLQDAAAARLAKLAELGGFTPRHGT